MKMKKLAIACSLACTAALTLGTAAEVQAHPGVIEAYLGGVDD